MIVAPLYDFAAINVPRQINEEATRREVLAQQGAQVLRRHAILDGGYALFDPWLQNGLVWLKIHDRDVIGITTPMCFSKWAACTAPPAPKPTNKIRFGNASIRYPPRRDEQANRAAKKWEIRAHQTVTLRQTSDKRQADYYVYNWESSFWPLTAVVGFRTSVISIGGSALPARQLFLRVAIARTVLPPRHRVIGRKQKAARCAVKFRRRYRSSRVQM